MFLFANKLDNIFQNMLLLAKKLSGYNKIFSKNRQEWTSMISIFFWQKKTLECNKFVFTTLEMRRLHIIKGNFSDWNFMMKLSDFVPEIHLNKVTKVNFAFISTSAFLPWSTEQFTNFYNMVHCFKGKLPWDIFAYQLRRYLQYGHLSKPRLSGNPSTKI